MKWCNKKNMWCLDMWRLDTGEEDSEVICCDGECNFCDKRDDVN